MRGCYAFVPAVAICLSECGDRLGDRAAHYRSDVVATVHLTLPGNAPYISQQFFVAAKDPHLFRMDGVGRFTCFEPERTYPDRPFRITSPTPCR